MKQHNQIINSLIIFIGIQCIALPSEIYANGSISTYYMDVEAQSQSPPPEDTLRTLCQTKNKDDGYITFVGVEENKALLYALTKKKMRKASTSIYLKTYIFKDPKALLKVTAWGPGVTPDWGYVFDRNQDGRVDYIAYMEGPRAVAPLDNTEELPVLTGEKFTLTGSQIVFLATNQPLGFWHVADDNYDGKIDGFAMRANAVSNGWSYGWMVVESTGFNDTFDKCTYYSEHDKSEIYSCESMNEGREYIVPGKYRTRSLPIEMYNKWLSMANNAARECGLFAKNIYGIPGAYVVNEKVEQPDGYSDNDLFE